MGRNVQWAKRPVTDIITFGYHVRLDFWKDVRQTEMVYVNSGGVYVLSYRCTLAWMALKVAIMGQYAHFDVLAAMKIGRAHV